MLLGVTPWKEKTRAPVSILLMAWSPEFVNQLTWRLKALGAPKVHLTSCNSEARKYMH